MAADGVINVALAGGVRGAGGVLAIDGAIPWIPPGVEGYEPCLVYALQGNGRSLLIDTGLPIHRPIVLAQLRRILPPETPLSIVTTRPEADCVGNVGAIVDEFRVERIVSLSLNPLEFFPAAMRRSGRTVRYERRRLGETWEWAEGRMIEFLPAPFGLLMTAWPYDAATQTLFTSDTFGWLHLRAPESSCLVDAPSPAATASVIGAHLACRFHWLSACRPKRVEDALRRVFAERPIRVIAPSHGCVFRGDATVEDQYGRVLDALQGMRGGPDLAPPRQ